MTASGPPETATRQARRRQLPARSLSRSLSRPLARARAAATPRPGPSAVRRAGRETLPRSPPATCPGVTLPSRPAGAALAGTSRGNPRDGWRGRPLALPTPAVAGTARRRPTGRGPGTGCPKCTAEATLHSVTEGRSPNRWWAVDPGGRHRRQLPTEGYASLPIVGPRSSTADQWSLTADRRCRST